MIDHWPQRCGCGRRFSERERQVVGDPARHQVSELPEISVWVTEHRLNRLRCPGCGATARAEPAGEVAAGAFGPRLVSATEERRSVERLLCADEVAEMIGMTRAYVYDLSRRGRIPTITFG